MPHLSCFSQKGLAVKEEDQCYYGAVTEIKKYTRTRHTHTEADRFIDILEHEIQGS